MTPIRYAIWAAVSTKQQAGPDKVSLGEQESRCRSAAQAQGWREAAGPYIVPGESRTRFLDLHAAEQEIPELRRMLEDARQRRFDVLTLFEYDRLRELIDPVYRVLASYRVQLYSVSQPHKIQPPETFDPYKEDTPWLMIDFNRIASRFENQKLRRKYAEGMPARVKERGLPANAIPFGYRKPPGREADRGAVPLQNPAQVPLVLQMKDMLLKGKSLRQITRMANASNIKPPRAKIWRPQTIREMLRNPFYAGFNRWGLSKNFTDLRTGRRYRKRDIPPEQVIVAPGQHKPLWDEDTHKALIEELDRRGNAYRGVKLTPLSRLLRCPCGATLWMHHNGPASEPERSIWRCSVGGTRAGHTNLPNSRALELVGLRLARDLAEENALEQTPVIQADEQTLKATQDELDELDRQRERIEDAYIAGGFPLDTYMSRIRHVDDRIATVKANLSAAEENARTRAERMAIIRSLAGTVEHLQTWLNQSDPQTVNRTLRGLLEYVVIDVEGVRKMGYR